MCARSVSLAQQYLIPNQMLSDAFQPLKVEDLKSYLFVFSRLMKKGTTVFIVTYQCSFRKFCQILLLENLKRSVQLGKTVSTLKGVD